MPQHRSTMHAWNENEFQQWKFHLCVIDVLEMPNQFEKFPFHIIHIINPFHACEGHRYVVVANKLFHVDIDEPVGQLCQNQQNASLYRCRL